MLLPIDGIWFGNFLAIDPVLKKEMKFTLGIRYRKNYPLAIASV
jgi:hypothetical protein